MKKTFNLVFIILGGFIGAGFASGREVSQFFAQFGWYGCLCAIMCPILLFYFIRLFLNVGKNFSSEQIFNVKILSKNYSINVVLNICTIIIMATMLAGSYSIGKSIDMEIQIYLITLVASYICIVNGAKGLTKTNFILIPLLLVTILIVLFLNTFNLNIDSFELQNPINSLFSMIIYVSLNILLLGVLLIQIGKYYSDKEIKNASLISSVIIGLFLFLLTFFIAFYSDSMYSEMPLLFMMNSKGSVAKYMVCIIVWVGLFTTLLSGGYVVNTNLRKNIKSPYLSCILLLCIVTIISLFGFTFLVKFGYFIIGIIGILFTVKTMLLYNNVKNNR